MDKFEIRIDRSGFNLTPHCKAYHHTCDFIGKAADGFTCELFHPDVAMLRLATKPFLQILFYINGRQQFRGQIDTQVIDDDGTIHLSCSDYLANSVDCSVGKNIQLPQGMTLRAAILKLMQSQQIRLVQSGWNVPRKEMCGRDVFASPPETDFTTRTLYENINVKQDDGIWETVSKICELHHCLPKAGLNNDILHLVAPEYRQQPQYTITRLAPNNPANNFSTQGGVTRDAKNFPTVLVACGEAGKSSEEKTGTYLELNPFVDYFDGVTEIQEWQRDNDRPNTFTGRFDYAKDSMPAGVIYREMRIHPDTKKERFKTAGKLGLESFAKRSLSDAVKDSLTFTAHIETHSLGATKDDPGAIVTPDTLVTVVDQIGGVFEDMWIAGVTRDFEDKKQSTSFTVFRPHAIRLGSETVPNGTRIVRPAVEQAKVGERP